MWNRRDISFKVTPGMRIAQMIFLPVGLPHLNVVEEHNDISVRGSGGLGSTGVL